MAQWIEHYECGCISEYVKHKWELPGYCPTHGKDWIQRFKETKDNRPISIQRNKSK